MSENAAVAPTPVTAEPTKAPPVIENPQGSAALTDLPKKKDESSVIDDPFEYELDVKGQKQKVKFSGKDQMKAVLQKALYADQVIKDAAQAKKGAADLMEKIKTRAGLREILSDPAIGVDINKWAIEEVQDMMEEEKLTPDQREARKAAKERDELKAWKEQRENEEKQKIQETKNQQLMKQVSSEIIEAMKKYPDIPQTQATMDACIQNMRTAFKRFGKHLTAEQAMSVYSQQYWNSLGSILDKMEPDAILKRFGQKTLDKIQKLKLQELREKTNPSNKVPETVTETKKKKHLTEKEYDKHFQQLAGL